MCVISTADVNQQMSKRTQRLKKTNRLILQLLSKLRVKSLNASHHNVTSIVFHEINEWFKLIFSKDLKVSRLQKEKSCKNCEKEECGSSRLKEREKSGTTIFCLTSYISGLQKFSGDNSRERKNLKNFQAMKK